MVKETESEFIKYYPLYRVLHDNERFGQDINDAIIKHMKPKHHKGLEEAVAIALSQNVEMPEKSVKALGKHVNELRLFNSSSKKKRNHQKRMLKKHTQKGGFMSVLIPVVASLLGSAASEGVSAIINAIKKHKKHNKNKNK
jgi:hypothetical protein